MLIFLKCVVALSVVLFIIGLIKPKWVLFWMKEPDRLTATSLALVLFMASVTVYSKLTLKPIVHAPVRHSDDANQLQLDNR